MKKTLILSLALILSLNLFAQEKVRQKEAGITFHNLDEFGLTYKFGNQKAMWRFNLLSISKSKSESDGVDFKLDNKTSGFDFSFGREFRSKISEDFEFRFGLDWFYKRVKNEVDNELTVSNKYTGYDPKTKVYTDEITNRNRGLQFVLGMNYVLKNKFVFGVEALPRWSWGKKEVETHNIKNVSGQNVVVTESNKIERKEFNLSSSNVRLSIAYRF